MGRVNNLPDPFFRTMLYEETYLIPDQRYYDDIEIINRFNLPVRNPLFNLRILQKILEDFKDTYTNVCIRDLDYFSTDKFQERLIRVMSHHFGPTETSDEILEEFWNYFKQNCFSKKKYCSEVIKICRSELEYIHDNFVSNEIKERFHIRGNWSILNDVATQSPDKLYEDFLRIDFNDISEIFRAFLEGTVQIEINSIMKNFTILFFYQRILDGVRQEQGKIDNQVQLI